MPGTPGAAGAAGVAGAPGAAGARGTPGDDGEDAPIERIPGVAGPTGAPGTIGVDGRPGPPGEDGEEGPFFIVKGDRGATGAAGGGGGTATIVEKDLGSTSAWQGKFTITDATIESTSVVLVWQAPGPYTGKGTRSDEAALAPVRITHVEPAAGSCVVHWRSVESHNPIVLTPQDHRVMGTVSPTRSDIFSTQGEIAGVTVRGKVRGNVKFAYLVFTP